MKLSRRNAQCQHPLEGSFAKGEFCRHDFMQVRVGRVPVGHGQAQGESFQV